MEPGVHHVGSYETCAVCGEIALMPDGVLPEDFLCDVCAAYQRGREAGRVETGGEACWRRDVLYPALERWYAAWHSVEPKDRLDAGWDLKKAWEAKP